MPLGSLLVAFEDVAGAAVSVSLRRHRSPTRTLEVATSALLPLKSTRTTSLPTGCSSGAKATGDASTDAASFRIARSYRSARKASAWYNWCTTVLSSSTASGTLVLLVSLEPDSTTPVIRCSCTHDAVVSTNGGDEHAPAVDRPVSCEQPHDGAVVLGAVLRRQCGTRVVVGATRAVGRCECTVRAQCG